MSSRVQRKRQNRLNGLFRVLTSEVEDLDPATQSRLALRWGITGNFMDHPRLVNGASPGEIDGRWALAKKIYAARPRSHKSARALVVEAAERGLP